MKAKSLNIAIALTIALAAVGCGTESGNETVTASQAADTTAMADTSPSDSTATTNPVQEPEGTWELASAQIDQATIPQLEGLFLSIESPWV